MRLILCEPSRVLLLLFFCLVLNSCYCRHLKKRDVDDVAVTPADGSPADTPAASASAEVVESTSAEQSPDGTAAAEPVPEAPANPEAEPAPGTEPQPNPQPDLSSVAQPKPGPETDSSVPSETESAAGSSILPEPAASETEPAAEPNPEPDALSPSEAGTVSAPGSDVPSAPGPDTIPASEPDASFLPGSDASLVPQTDTQPGSEPQPDTSVLPGTETGPDISGPPQTEAGSQPVPGTDQDLSLSPQPELGSDSPALLPEAQPDASVLPQAGPDPEPEPQPVDDIAPETPTIIQDGTDKGSMPPVDAGGAVDTGVIGTDSTDAGTPSMVVPIVPTDGDVFPFEGGFIFDSPFFSFKQIEDYFMQLERAMEKIFRQTMAEVGTDPDVYKNTTERIVDVDGRKYKVHTTVIKGGDENNAVSIEAVSAIPADRRRRKRSLF